MHPPLRTAMMMMMMMMTTTMTTIEIEFDAGSRAW
jgi:hypothetical protein